MPNKFLTKMRYAASLEVTAGSLGATTLYHYSCNNLFDPDVTGTGHQPRGFDQLMTMYNKFTVIGATIKVQIASEQGESVPENIIAGINLRSTINSSTNLNDWMENRNMTSVMLSGGLNIRSKTFTYKVNPAKFLGISHPLSDHQLSGTTTTGPVRQCFFSIFVSTPQGIGTSKVQYQVTIDYTVVLHEPKFMIES